MSDSRGRRVPAAAVPSDSEVLLQEKVLRIEKSLKIFRSEVDMKMKMMEQILTTRNEQFIIHQQLLSREHELYKTVLEHWKSTADLAASGLSLHFSQEGDDPIGLEEENKDLPSNSSTSASAKRARRKRLRAKRLRTCQGEDGYANNMRGANGRMEVDVEQCLMSDADEDYVAASRSKGMQRKVFINVYANPGSEDGERSSDPIWSYFLREDTGETSLCKLCDEGGIQKIINIADGDTFPLNQHLIIDHQLEIGSGEGLPLHNTPPHNQRRRPQREGVSRQRQRALTSPVWNYFTKYFADDGSTRGRCKLCADQGGETSITIVDSSTTRLHSHLKSVHSIDSAAMPRSKPTEGENSRANSEAVDSSPRKRASASASGEKRLPSIVWNYFTKSHGDDQESQYSRCHICEENGVEILIQTWGGSTSKLHHHLKSAHDIDTKAATPNTSTALMKTELNQVDSESEGHANNFLEFHDGESPEIDQ